jgi:prophage DNA circulation protein
MSFFGQLQQASFGGVPFGVLGADATFGRRQAVHQYPFRDQPWVEDLGKSVRRINLTDFLIENSAIYGGGDVISQREALAIAAESSGVAPPIHPMLGRLDINAANVTVSERSHHGRAVTCRRARVFGSVSGDAVSGRISPDRRVHRGVKAGGDNTAGPQ